jgi:hypothetical protein
VSIYFPKVGRSLENFENAAHIVPVYTQFFCDLFILETIFGPQISVGDGGNKIKPS